MEKTITNTPKKQLTTKSFLNKIIQADCLNLAKQIPNESIGLVVSSPPYNIGKSYEERTNLEQYLATQAAILSECARMLKSGGSIFWQVGSYVEKDRHIPLDIKIFPILENLGLRSNNRIIWVRQHGLHARNKFSHRHETILWFSKGAPVFNLDPIRVPQKYQNKKSHRGDNKGELSCNPLGKNPGDVWAFQNVKHNHEEQTIHPCQFPEDLISRIILASTEVNDVVFDPYGGTGTVAVVAKDLNRQFIVSEIDKTYVDIAQRRLDVLPDEKNSFPNLKTLRKYIERTGEPIEKYRFDVQVGKVATPASSSKIFSEQHHLTDLEKRLEIEEGAFSERLLLNKINPLKKTSKAKADLIKKLKQP